MSYILTAGELIDFLRRFPPGSEILHAKDATTFIPITNVTGIGFVVDRATNPPTYVRRKATDEQTSELGVVLWPSNTPILELVAGEPVKNEGND